MSPKINCDPEAGPVNQWKPQIRLTVLAVFAANIGTFCFGTVLTWSTVALKDITERNVFGSLADHEISWIASLVFLGALSSSPLAGYLVPMLGPKKTLLLTAFPTLLGWLLIAFAQNLPMIYIGRFITGFCTGMFPIVAPSYATDISEDRIRGTMGIMMILMLVLGTEFTYILGAFLSWFWLAIVCATVPVIFFIGLISMPESPRHLYTKGEEEACKNALKRLRGAPSFVNIENEFLKIEKSVCSTSTKTATLSDLLSLHILHPIAISIGLLSFGQLSGANGVLLYTVQVFEDAGTEIDPNLASIIIGGCQVLAVLFVPFVLVETLGRKTLMLASEAMMIIGLAAFGTFFYFKKTEDAAELTQSLGWLPLTCLVLIVLGNNIGMGVLPFVVTAEILPAHVRPLALSVITIFYRSLTFVSGKTFTDLKALLDNHGLWWMHTGICILGSLFIITFVPETKGKCSEEIQKHFAIKEASRNNNDKNINISSQEKGVKT